MNLAAAVAFGIVHGARHTFEPDHLAAVSVMVTSTRGLRRAAWLGALWGLGHTVALTAVAAVLIVAGANLPATWDAVFALLIGVLLVVLGVRAMVLAQVAPRETIAADPTQPHAHKHPHRPLRSPLQALAVGTLHGMAGSGAITALAVAGMSSLPAQVGFVLVFGLASTLGMATVSAIAGATFARVARPWLARALGAVVGLVSIVIGVQTVWAALAALR